MKKIFCFLVCAVLLCGCASESPVTPVTKGIKFTAKITWYNEMFTCTGEIPEENSASFDVVEPESIAGLKITCEGDEVTANYNGIETVYDVSSSLYSGICEEVYSAMRDTWQEDVQVVEEDSQLYIEGTAHEQKYKMIIAPTGLPLSLEIPNESFRVIFEDVTITN